ncbi:hypothetical protein DM01DRAFT_1338790 [Hesseltinella vesiculosa]|uniref:PHD-type domain-containing protein n=1 Tax=Hesseltinella vesiculosa TaxID=101127 RepID=A0A1X2G8N7_9FUNG|nr:hypothetical protein DM01DRAFT_1338790 [Hesseltinella vesiculosa]
MPDQSDATDNESHPQDHDDDIDEAGEKKIDSNGNLQDDRSFKVPTFTLPTRGELVMMLAMDPAKLLGFRDSNVFFNKNRTLQRVRLTDEEKDVLVDRGLVIPWFRHREVAVVTARSIFKRFGAKVIKKGRRCRDDYFEALARAEGFTGELVVMEKKTELMHLAGDLNREGHHYDDNGRIPLLSSPSIVAAATAKVIDTMPTSPLALARAAAPASASSGASSITPLTLHQHPPISSTVTAQEWMYQCVQQLRVFNTQLQTCREQHPVFFDMHTNVNQIASATQPTQCKYVDVSDKNTIEFDHHDASTAVMPSVSAPLSDPTIQQILAYLPPAVQASAKSILKPCLPLSLQEADDAYPLALMDNQYQGLFPTNFTRFGFGKPDLDSAGTMVSKSQSMMAQQFYLNQLYFFVGQQRKRNIVMPPSSFLPPTEVSPTDAQAHEPPATEINGVEKNSEKKVVKSPALPQCAECKHLSAPNNAMDEYGLALCDPFFMVGCANCHRKYHPNCAHLTTPKQLAAVDSYPWYCPECKFCCICRSTGDETKLMMCDGCDRGWHTDCCTPPVVDIPEGQWLCPLCAICHSCSSIDVVGGNDRSNEFIHAVAPATKEYSYPVYLATYCSPCYQNFMDDRFCPVCMRSYTDGDDVAEDDKEMVTCDKCERWIHTRCDKAMTPKRYNEICDDENAKYTCPMCAGDYCAYEPENSLSMLAMNSLGPPRGTAIGEIGEKVRTRGVVLYKNFKVGVPEITGAGTNKPSQM